jgi:hypothetical protein
LFWGRNEFEEGPEELKDGGKGEEAKRRKEIFGYNVKLSPFALLPFFPFAPKN